MTTDEADKRRYRETGPLAQGGMAVLSRGERDDGVTVVIKRIRPPFEHDAGYRGLFRDEGAVAERLDSEHIVRLLDRGEDDLGPYLVFEHIDGTDLGVVLARLFEEERGLDLGAFFAVALPMSAALHAAHTACGDDGACLDVVHRDVSPGNVLLAKDGDVKLADFGVAASALKTEHTVAGEMKGKFAYMAPEQTRGEKVDARADVFAAGAVLWECLTARKLFDGPTDADIVHAVREQEIEPPSAHNEDVPPALDDVVLRMLAQAPDKRFADAEQAHAALKQVARDNFCDTGQRKHITRLARAYPRPEVAEHPHVTELRRRTQRVMQAPVAASRARARRGGTARLWVAAAVVVGVASVALWLARPSPQPATEEPSPSEPVALPSVRPAPPPSLPALQPSPPIVAVAPGTAPVDPPVAEAPLPKAPPAKPTVKAATKKPRPERESPVASRPPAAPDKGFGLLFLNTEPWSEVAIDGNPLGQQTPLVGMRLPAGRHTVTLSNPHYEISRTITIDIEAGAETRRFVDLTER